jgi:phasin family protein
MDTKTLAALTDPGKSVIESIQKRNQQASATVAKLAAHRIESLKAYSDLAVNQLNAAAEVKDVEGLQALMSKQSDFLVTYGRCLMSDITTTAQLGMDFLWQAATVDAEATPAKTQAPAAPGKAKAA